MNDALITSMLHAVEASPDDATLRLHLGRLLLDAGRGGEAVSHAAIVLQHDPGNIEAQTLMARAIGSGRAEPEQSQQVGSGFDWARAEGQVADLAAPMYIDSPVGDDAGTRTPDQSAFDVQRSTVTLADVGGMSGVKQRLDAAFLAPMRNPELRQLYGKTLRGGLLLYGPPGCGKTFLGRAVAGELGAKFIAIGIADVLDMWLGSSERNLHEAFQLARREAPCVLFFDEIDALGQRRTSARASAMRGTINQLLNELDGVENSNDGVFVLAATNQPWDVDPALRRPGRLDRTILVLPPDQAARVEIFRYHLSDRPIEGIELAALAKATDGYSGADIAHVCETAAERALLDSVAAGQPRLIVQADLVRALDEVEPSIGPWLETARNVVLFGGEERTYQDLRAYLKKAKRL